MYIHDGGSFKSRLAQIYVGCSEAGMMCPNFSAFLLHFASVFFLRLRGPNHSVTVYTTNSCKGLGMACKMCYLGDVLLRLGSCPRFCEYVFLMLQIKHVTLLWLKYDVYFSSFWIVHLESTLYFMQRWKASSFFLWGGGVYGHCPII